MTRKTKIAIAAAVAAVLLGGAGLYALPGLAQGFGPWGYGQGMMGYGPGGQQGYGPGMMGPGMMGGYGPGGQQGYGPGMMGPGMMGGYGPGMMARGYGPGMGMMQQGYGPENCPMGQAAQGKELTTADVTRYLERDLDRRGGERLKIGKVEEKDKTIVAEVVTKKENAVVWTFEFDKATGRMTRVD